MKRCGRNLTNTFVAASVLLLFAGTAWADVYSVSIDVSTLGDFELEFQLWNNSEVLDSYALVDNVVFGAVLDDFESGLGGFDDSLNTSSVNPVGGSLNGTGVSVLRIDENPTIWPTITFRDYAGSDATTLLFDFEMSTTSTEGFWGYDELVVSILDPSTLYPLLPGLTSFGDVLRVSYTGISHTEDVTVVPVPGAVLLAGLGLGTSAFGLFRKKRRLQK